MHVATDVVVAAMAYLLGSVSTGYYLVKWQTGKDIRDLGSGASGARNAGRLLGRTGFVLTFAGDLAKGACAVWLAKIYGLNITELNMVMLFVVIGHIWPVQLGFRGGKGIAPAIGALSILDIRLIFPLLILFFLFLAALRKFTLSGLLTSSLSPLVALTIGRPKVEIYGLSLLAAVILYAHRANISNIIQELRGKN